jgi:integrase
MIKGQRFSGTSDTLDEALRERSTVMETLSKADQKTITLSQVIKEVLNIRWGTQKGIKTTTSALHRIVEYFAPDTDIQTIDNKAVKNYIEHCIAQQAKPATINRRLSALKVLVKYARLMGYTSSLIEISPLKENNTRTLALSEADAQTILTCIKNQDMKDIFKMLYETGLRLSELLRLAPRDITQTSEYATLTVQVSKNGQPRTLPLPGCLNPVICRRPSGRLFPYTKEEVYKMWDDMKKEIPLDVLGIDSEQFTPHVLRHSCITNLAKRGLPITEIQRWAGHTSVNTTMRYIHLQGFNTNLIKDA